MKLIDTAIRNHRAKKLTRHYLELARLNAEQPFPAEGYALIEQLRKDR